MHTNKFRGPAIGVICISVGLVSATAFLGYPSAGWLALLMIACLASAISLSALVYPSVVKTGSFIVVGGAFVGLFIITSLVFAALLGGLGEVGGWHERAKQHSETEKEIAVLAQAVEEFYSNESTDIAEKASLAQRVVDLGAAAKYPIGSEALESSIKYASDWLGMHQDEIRKNILDRQMRDAKCAQEEANRRAVASARQRAEKEADDHALSMQLHQGLNTQSLIGKNVEWINVMLGNPTSTTSIATARGKSELLEYTSRYNHRYHIITEDGVVVTVTLLNK